MASAPILVLGGTGTIGSRVVTRLGELGQPVRVASRSSDPAFDWTDDSTWQSAIGDAERVFVMSPDEVPVAPEFLRLAADSGAQRVVLLSSGAIEEMHDQRLLDAEAAVKAAGPSWTILRPSWFDQNFDEGFLRADVDSGTVRLPVGDVRQCFVDAADIAAVAAVALTEDGHDGRTYEVRGPQALTFADAVEVISDVIGRQVGFEGDDVAWTSAMVEAGMPAEEADGAAGAFASLRECGDDEPNGVVLEVSGRQPIPFEEYARAAHAGGAWSG